MQTLKFRRNIFLLLSIFILLSGALSVSGAQDIPTFTVPEFPPAPVLPAAPAQPALVNLSAYSAVTAPAVPSGLSFGLASATFTVNDLGDAADTDTSDNVCDIDSGTPGSQCTLRAAIEQANATVDLDTIAFNIPGLAPFVITPATVLPVITNPVVIDGTTQTGYTTTPVISLELNGLNYGLAVAASNSSIIALHIAEAQVVHIQLTGSNNVVKRSYIGTDIGGVAGQSIVGVGIGIQGSANTIGGTAAGDGNLISGLETGVYVEGAAVGNTILGNAVGVDAAKTAAITNSTGIHVVSARGTIIGGAATGAGNLISGNAQGIFVDGAVNTRIQGNVVGLDGTGIAPLSNSVGIVTLNATKTNIGGAAAGAGNLISGNSTVGVGIAGAGTRKAKVFGNRIGTNAAGTANIPNTVGVYIFSSPGTKIGGAAAGQGNLISGNLIGMRLEMAAGTKIQGNKIGTDINGIAALPNMDGGIITVSSSNVTIGGTAAGARNLISGNDMALGGQANTNLTIQGNYVGTNLNGTAAVPNGQGIILTSNLNTLIGGSVPNAGNLISGNTGPGVILQIDGSVTIQQNLIGTDAAGTAALPNGGAGLGVLQSSNILIGGSGAARNIISGNVGPGIILQGPNIGVQLQGNYIGTTKNGLEPLGNAGPGIVGVSLLDTVIGGSKALRNVISANSADGIILVDTLTSTITGNYIGTNRKGKSAAGMGNAGNGIILMDSEAMVIGGAGALANRILDNTMNGILIAGATSARIQGNRISGNGGLGIDLNDDGVSPNDPFDADAGPNNFQNYPVLTDVKTNAVPKTKIKGTLNGTPFGIFVLDFYTNTECDASGFGEGAIYLGQKRVVADANGDVTFKAKFPVQITAGAGVVATATDSNGNTSEFSECLTTLAAPVLVGPADGATGIAQGTAISWNAVGSVTEYQIQIDDNEDFSSPEVNTFLNTTSTTADAPLIAATTYFWRVRAVGAGGYGKWSEVRDFGYTG